MNTVLELRDLTKHYPTHQAVNGISLGLKQGEFFSLLGPSGCGKTTTLRLIGGFESPTAGEIVLNGEAITTRKAYHRNVSTVFQNYALFPHLTVERNVSFGLEQQARRRPGEIAARVSQLLSLMQLTGKENRLPAQLSGGERQRVALARALAPEPDVLLLDEPLSALDPKLRKQMRIELKAIQKRVGTTFLFITHDQEEAMSLSDRMAVMNGGHLEQVGTPEELYRRPCSRFVAEFLGDVNWIEGCGIRPESVQLSRERPSSLQPVYPANVVAQTYLGNCTNIHLKTVQGDACTVQAQGTVAAEYEPGETVYLWWNAADQLPVSVSAQNIPTSA